MPRSRKDRNISIPCLTRSMMPGLSFFSLPDFEAEEGYFDGKVKMHGRILIIHVILFALALFRQKKFRRFISVIRKSGKKAGKKKDKGKQEITSVETAHA